MDPFGDPFGDPFADESAPSKPVVKKAILATKPAIVAAAPVAAAAAPSPKSASPAPAESSLVAASPVAAAAASPPSPPLQPVAAHVATRSVSFLDEDEIVPPPAEAPEADEESDADASEAAEAEEVDDGGMGAAVPSSDSTVSIVVPSPSASPAVEVIERATTPDHDPLFNPSATASAAVTPASASSSSSPSAAIASSSSASAAIASLAASYVDLDEEARDDELALEGLGLDELPDDVIRARGATLRRIDLTSNKLTTLKSLAWTFGLPAWPCLTELILDKNQLEGINGIGQIPSLTTLWLNNNRVDDLDALLDSVERLFPKLTYLSMMRNPAAPDMYFSDGEMEAYGRYRLYVIYRLRNLQFLDSTEVTPEERKEATLRGAYCRVAKPVSAKPKAGSKEEEAARLAAASPASPVARQSTVGLDKNAKPPKVATFLAKGKPRYDGTNSEGNRFIMNDDL